MLAATNPVFGRRASPTPILFVVAKVYTITVTDLALGAYERTLEPKRLALIDGGHFAPYDAEFRKRSRGRREVIQPAFAAGRLAALNGSS